MTPPRDPDPEVPWLSQNAVAVDRQWARALGASEVSPADRRLALSRLAFVHRQNPWLSVPINEHWRVAYRLAVQDGAVVVSEVRVFPREGEPRRHPDIWSAEILGIKAPVPRGGITSRLLRRVTIGAHHRVADAVLRRNADWYPIPLPLERRRPAKAGRPRKADLYFARLAQAYVHALRDGSKRPIQDVARVQRLPPAQVRDAIFRARERGLLSRVKLQGQAGQQGQRGGQLTPKAVALVGAGRGKRSGRSTTKRRERRG